jgi:hypothetical protein
MKQEYDNLWHKVNDADSELQARRYLRKISLMGPKLDEEFDIDEFNQIKTEIINKKYIPDKEQSQERSENTDLRSQDAQSDSGYISETEASERE